MGATLDGVTTAILLFIFTCLVIPNFIKNRTQFYAAFAGVLGIILLNTLALMIQSPKFNVIVGVFVGFLQLVCVIMLVMCVGGMSAGTLAGEMGRAYEVIRRGEEEKQVIIPLSGAKPKEKDEEAQAARINLDSVSAQTPKSPDQGLPLE